MQMQNKTTLTRIKTLAAKAVYLGWCLNTDDDSQTHLELNSKQYTVIS